MAKWFVIAIDWKKANVLEKGLNSQEDAEGIASMYDDMALRAIAVPEGDPRIREETNVKS